MTSKTFKKSLICSVVLGVCGSKMALAANADLALTVSGSVAPMPQWQDSSNNPLSQLTFVFSGVAGLASSNVDSASVGAKLVNALSYPASVSVTTPSGCSIGTSNVTNNDVQLLVGGTVAGNTVSLATNGISQFSLRFASNYGDKSGAVNCSSGGRLRYTY
jgi:hypothetical protein